MVVRVRLLRRPLPLLAMSLRTASPPQSFPAFRTGTPPVELRGRQGRSGTTIHGWPAVLFGMPFAGAGVFLVLLAAGLVGTVDPGRDAPPWVVLAIGLLFAVVGLLLQAHGARGVARRRRTERFRRKFPGQPWAWEHRWTVGGSADETGREITRSLATAAVVALLLVPFHWVGFVAPDGPVAFAVLSLLFDAVVALIVGRASYLAMRRARFGRRTLRFARF